MRSRSKAKVFIRTVTYFYTGRVIGQDDREIVLDHAAWIADTGRYADAMRTGVFSEVEPYPPEVVVRIQRSAIVEIVGWIHDLPKDQK
jgi:hypothetical protein